MKMRIFQSNKLWRDKAVALTEQDGSRVHWRRLDDVEFDKQLRLKLLEEADEIVKAQSQKELAAEIADLLDVVEALSHLNNITPEEIAKIRTKKYVERGGFENRVFVEKHEHPEGSFGVKYCLAQPEKYPEITD